MNSPDAHASLIQSRFIRVIYLSLLVIMTFTGFGQMPIFKRYYLSDLPGFGWSADYYLTHYIHYVGAAVLIGLFFLLVTDYFLMGRKAFRLTFASYVRVFLLAVIVLTGIFRVLKNFPEILFSPGFTVFIDSAHFGFVLILFFMALIFKILKMPWSLPKDRSTFH